MILFRPISMKFNFTKHWRMKNSFCSFIQIFPHKKKLVELVNEKKKKIIPNERNKNRNDRERSGKKISWKIYSTILKELQSSVCESMTNNWKVEIQAYQKNGGRLGKKFEKKEKKKVFSSDRLGFFYLLKLLTFLQLFTIVTQRRMKMMRCVESLLTLYYCWRICETWLFFWTSFFSTSFLFWTLYILYFVHFVCMTLVYYDG